MKDKKVNIAGIIYDVGSSARTKTGSWRTGMYHDEKQKDKDRL